MQSRLTETQTDADLTPGTSSPVRAGGVGGD
jgi:hypothetical protein